MTMYKELRYFVDDRGYSLFDIFPTAIGQINLSKLDKGVVKAFHRHLLQDDFVLCISGRAKLVTANEDWSGVEETYLNPRNQKIVRIPHGKWHGYKALEEDTVILYYCTVRYNTEKPDELRSAWDSVGKEVWDISNA